MLFDNFGEISKYSEGLFGILELVSRKLALL